MSKTKSTAPATSSDAPAVRPGPTYRSRPRRREFLIMVATEEIFRMAGLGMTLDDVIADITDTFASSRALHREKEMDAVEDTVEHCDDQVVWEANRVLAVLRPAPDGSGMDVVRFDGDEPAGPA